MKKTIIFLCFFLTATTSFTQDDPSLKYIAQVNLLLEQDNAPGAISVLGKAIREMPDSAKFYNMRGTILEAFQMYNEAIADFTAAMDRASNPKRKSHYLSNRGGTKFRIRDFEGAYADLSQAAKVDSSNIDALNNLAAVCDEVNRSDETLGYLQQVIRIDPEYVPAYVNIGFRYQNDGEHEMAVEYFDKAIELAPDEPLAYSNRSFSRLKLSDLAGALADVDHSLELYAANSYAYKIRALILIEKEEFDRACKDLTTAEELGYTQQYGSEVNDLQKKHCQ